MTTESTGASQGAAAAPSRADREQRLLRHSVYATLFFALLGIAWGVGINSSVVMFDGLYSLVSVALSFLSLIVTAELEKPDDRRFQFGRAMLEPLVIALKSIGIAIMCAYALFAAVQDLLRGGVEVSAAWGAAYAILASAAGFVGWRYLLRRGGQDCSDLLQAEADQWYMDTMLSVAVALGFLGSSLLGLSPWHHLTPYVDPVMVIIIASYVIRTPAAMLLGAAREIVMTAPPGPLHEEVRRIVLETLELPHEEVVIRQAKVGRQLIVDVGVLVRAGTGFVSVSAQDTLRQQLEDRLVTTGLAPWLTVHFSGEEKWL